MDNSPPRLLEDGLAQLGLPVSRAPALWSYAELMLRWNQRVNLTAITDPAEVVDKHLLDSVAVLGEVPAGPRSVLDVGAGAGLPGIPWALLRDDLHVTLVDAVQKKVAFMKSAIATLRLAGRVKALHQRAMGKGDGLGEFDVVTSRAFTDIDRWVPLASQYLREGGVVLAMVGQPPEPGLLVRLAEQSGLLIVNQRRFSLPISGDGRGVVVLKRPPSR